MVTMYADFSDGAYAALMRGDAVDNNGLRSKKGSYYPDQPSFRLKPTMKEELRQVGIDFASCLTYEILCPVIQHFVTEKVYPALMQEWDDWLERRAEKKRKAGQNKAPAMRSPARERRDVGHKRNVINLSDYRQGA